MTEQVLAREEFAPAQPGLVDRVLQEIVDFLFRIVDALGGEGSPALDTARVVLLVVIVGGTVALVVRFLRRVQRDAGDQSGLETGIGRAPTDWEADARAHEAAGRWREAVRCRYRLLVARLAEQGVVEEIAGRTSGEYLREALAGRPGAEQPLRRATDTFERAWYSGAPVTSDDVSEMRTAVEDVERARRTPVGAGVGGVLEPPR